MLLEIFRQSLDAEAPSTKKFNMPLNSFFFWFFFRFLVISTNKNCKNIRIKIFFSDFSKGTHFFLVSLSRIFDPIHNEPSIKCLINEPANIGKQGNADAIYLACPWEFASKNPLILKICQNQLQIRPNHTKTLPRHFLIILRIL